MVTAAAFLAPSLLLLAAIEKIEGQIKEGGNARQFSILCRVYQVASSHASNTYNAGEATIISGEIDRINASLSDDGWFDKFKPTAGQPTTGADPAPGGTLDEDETVRFRRAVAEVVEGTTVKKLSSSNPSAKVFQLKLRRIESQVETIRQKIGKLLKEGKADEMVQKFQAAIRGDKKSEGEVFSAGGDRATVCGKPNGGSAGTGAGASLMLDLLCLCADATSHVQKVCGSSVDQGTAASKIWNPSNGNNGQQNWDTIKAGCSKLHTHEAGGPETGYEAIAEFITHIALGDDGNSATPKVGLFGTCNGDCAGNSHGCTGRSTSQHGICVFYHTNTGDNIAWVKHMREGLRLLGINERNRLTIQNEIARLRVLQTRAEEVYDEAKTASELEKSDLENPAKNQSQRQIPTSVTDKTVAHESTAVSSAVIARFILPWTLLI